MRSASSNSVRVGLVVLTAIFLNGIARSTSLLPVDVCVRLPFFEASNFLGNEHVWLTPADGMSIMVTRNGGQSWNADSADKTGWQISFADSTYGWAINEGWLLKTINGGESWTPVTQLKIGDIALERPRQMLFTSQRTGFILETYRGLWVTSDSGRTWQIYALTELEPFRMYRIGAQSILLTGVDGKAVNVFVQYSKLKIEKLDMPVALTESDIFFISPSLGWVLVNNVIYKKEKNGRRFVQLPSTPNLPYGSSLESIHFISEQAGWVSGSQARYVTEGKIKRLKWIGYLFQTTDGGKTWQKAFEKDGLPFDKVHFTDWRTGWILADDKALRSIDGGLTWTQVLDMKKPNKCT